MSFEAAAVRVLLCDADDNLFGSEVPAFEASTRVTNDLLGRLGIADRFAPADLRRWAAGRNFRATVTALAAEHGARLDPDLLEAEVVREREAVVAHLARTLRPDPEVLEPLTVLAERFALAAVSSSALGRLDACFTATGLAGLLPADRRFSAEDSLERPASKPDPAVYRHAAAALGLDGPEALAVEDSVSGVRSSVGAGIPVVGNLQFVGEGEREERRGELLRAGAVTVVADWRELHGLLST